MRPDKTLFALIMLGALASCYAPTQSSYSPTIAEQAARYSDGCPYHEAPTHQTDPLWLPWTVE